MSPAPPAGPGPGPGPGRRPRPARSRTPFGTTWWGKAWVRTLEQQARFDENRLPRGRTYLRQDRVGVLTAEAGEVRASVRGSRDSAYRVRVRVRPFTEAEWEVVLDAISAKAAHAAALLDGELSPAIAADVEAAGLDLLPGPGEITTSCSCPDWANPCKHAAAVCYLVADLLDDDPFTLLLLRGRNRDQMLAGLRARRAAARSRAHDPTASSGPSASARKAGRAGGDEGVVASAAFSAERPPLPQPPLPPGHPSQPAPLASDAPVGSPVTADELQALAADAAERAWALATGESDGGLGLSADEDLARRAADALGTGAFPEIARRSTLPPADLMRGVLAWRHGGAGAVAVLDDRWNPPAEVLDDARAALEAAGTAQIRIDGNRALGTGIQLRYGRDGRWYRFEQRGTTWHVAATPPDADPSRLLAPRDTDVDVTSTADTDD